MKKTVLSQMLRHHLLFEEAQLLLSGYTVRSTVLRFEVLRVLLILTPFSELLS